MANLYLKIQEVNQTCLLELSWGKGQQITAEVNYPDNIIRLYTVWQQAYYDFYNHQEFRGRVISQGVINQAPVDRHAKLVKAEATLLYEFHQWLRDRKLYEIREVVGKTSKQIVTQTNKKTHETDTAVNVFIICNSLELARLPWESWELGKEFAADKIRVIRQPINIIQPSTDPVIGRKARILAILGDDNGLSFSQEKQALKSLEKVIDVQIIGWEAGKDINDLKQEITNNLKSDRGWDILFFAGHSNETNLTGGEITIAPNHTISLHEIERPLTIAKENGLQVAIFNSCKGLSIANRLIDLGLSQIAVMREPIHNQVAIEFFLRFSQALSEYKDIYECLLSASQYLRLEKNLTYPSAYLVPSLFSHPAATLFRITPFGIKQRLKGLIPTPVEAIAISALTLISIQVPVQGWLLEKRVETQAIYRQITGQVESVQTPPVLLVQIDNESINKAGILSPRPMNRQYLASLVDKLVDLQAPVVGIDYLLDRPDKNRDRILAKSIQRGLTFPPTPTRFVFAKTRDKNAKWLVVNPEIASPNWILPGEIELLPGYYMQLIPRSDENPKPRAFAFLLAISHQLRKHDKSPKPQLESKQDFWQQINNYITNHNEKDLLHKNPRSRLQNLTVISYGLGQMWLHPIVDFSIPPGQVYQTIPAWELLESKAGSSLQKQLQQQVVIIAPGAYGEAGTAKDGEDNFELPAALAFWRNQKNNHNRLGVMTGGEVHSYMMHHYLKNRMVIPIPDVWMIGLAILLGKFLSHYLSLHQVKRSHVLMLLSIGTPVYGLICLQTYISSTALLLPWLLPTVTFWFYILHALLGKKVYE